MIGQQHNSNQRAAVEAIVRQVLAELRAGGNALPRTTHTATSELTLTSKVVSAEVLEGRLSGVTRLIVPRGAIFTPAARDELKKYAVTVASAVSSKKTPAVATLHVGIAETSYNAEPLLSALVAERMCLERHSGCDLASLMGSLTSGAAIGVALLVTDQSAAALCLANRSAGVRAVLASSTKSVDAAIASVGPNMLVVEPTGRSVFEMKQTISRWIRHGQPLCPPALQAHLG